VKLDLKAPHTVYRSKDGRKLTGVTTYLGVLAKPSLLKWYATEERKGVLASVANGSSLPTGPFAEAKRDRAADLGTITHARIEAWLKNDSLEPDGIPADLYERSVVGFDRFRRWWGDEGFTVVESEKQLVHDGPMEYGGTADIVARDRGGNLVLIDIKTSKASPYWPYDEVYAQVSAYSMAMPDKPQRVIVVRVGKDEGDEIQVVELAESDIVAGWKIFLGAHEVYEAKKELARSKRGKDND